MSIYVDMLITYGSDTAPLCFRNRPSCHMYADSLEELHKMAITIGLKVSWFQNNRILPHYDLTPSKRTLAINKGAIETDRYHLVAYMKNKRMEFKK